MCEEDQALRATPAPQLLSYRDGFRVVVVEVLVYDGVVQRGVAHICRVQGRSVGLALGHVFTDDEEASASIPTQVPHLSDKRRRHGRGSPWLPPLHWM